MVTSYQVLEPSFPSNAPHLDLEIKARKFLTNFPITSLHCFLAKYSPSKRGFRKKIARLKSAKKTVSFLIVKNASLATTYPNVCRLS